MNIKEVILFLNKLLKEDIEETDSAWVDDNHVVLFRVHISLYKEVQAIKDAGLIITIDEKPNEYDGNIRIFPDKEHYQRWRAKRKW